MRSRIMRLFSTSISALLVFTLLLSTLPVFAHAEEDNDPVIVVSLGDSYSSGEGIEPFYGQNKDLSEKVEDKDWLAHRSEKSWPSLLKVPGIEGTMGNYRADYGAVSENCEWYFGAVSGAETKHFNTEKQEKKYVKDINFGLILTPIYISGKTNLPKQLDIFNNNGINGSVDYVTLTVGGNDVGFSDIVTTCVTNCSYLHFGATSKLEDTFEDLWADFDTTRNNIKNVYLGIREAAGRQAAIIVAGYPKLLDKDGKGAVINKQEATLVNENVSLFNDAIYEIIDELDGIVNIHFVDVESEFDKDGGHQAYSSNAWINEVMLGAQSEDISDLSIASSYSIHPNEEGAKAYARCVNAKIEEIEENSKTGILSGKIVKASDRTTPVTTATVNVVKGNKTISFQPDSNGSYTRELPVGTHYVKVVADGYIEFNAYADIEEDQTAYMETFLMVEGEEGEIGTSTGKITNAVTGGGVEGVKLDVRSGWNNGSVGEILTTVTTNSSGEYMVTLPIGNYTLSASKDGYVSTMLNIIVQKDVCTRKDGSMTPIVSGENFRITLDWGMDPSDLDSHVVGTLSDGRSFHVAYWEQSQYDGDVEVCNLDLDDVDGEGPETITLNVSTNEPYYYFIHRFAGSGSIATSNARINVYQGTNHIGTFNAPTDQGDGDIWNVFAIVDGQLIVRNTITDSEDTSYANADVAMFSFRSPNRLEQTDDAVGYPAKEYVPTTTEPELSDETIDATEEIITEESSVIANPAEAIVETAPEIETQKIYLSLEQFGHDYTWKVTTQDAEYDVTEEAEDIYSVELPVDAERIFIRGENEEHKIASAEISLDDIQENNCIVALACKDDANEFDIMWGIYDPATEEITFEVEENLVSIEETVEETIATEPTEALEASATEETESTSEEIAAGEETEDPEDTDAVS